MRRLIVLFTSVGLISFAFEIARVYNFPEVPAHEIGGCLTPAQLATNSTKNGRAILFDEPRVFS